MADSHVGSYIFISQILLIPSDTNLLFILKHCQFPIRIAFFMIVNKSQSQILNHVGLYLLQPVFSYGQLYIALLKITSY
jgi:hypothetical protein